jgi:hypothetical protein
MYFDEVILLPYFKTRVSDQFIGTEKNMAITITQQEKKITRLTNQLQELKEQHEKQTKEFDGFKSKYDYADYDRREELGSLLLVYLDVINCLPGEFRGNSSFSYYSPNLRAKVVNHLEKLFADYNRRLQLSMATENAQPENKK